METPSRPAQLTACNDIRSHLIECIRESDCIQRKPFHECLKSDDLDITCAQWRRAFWDCRRGQVRLKSGVIPFTP